MSDPFVMASIMRKFPDDISINTLYPNSNLEFPCSLYVDYKFIVSPVDKWEPIILELDPEKIAIISAK